MGQATIPSPPAIVYVHRLSLGAWELVIKITQCAGTNSRLRRSRFKRHDGIRRGFEVDEDLRGRLRRRHQHLRC